MTKIESVCLLLMAVCLVQCVIAAPVTEARDGNNNLVDDIIVKLKQLRLQNEGNGAILYIVCV
jgi:hypothetical protein